MSIYGGTLDAVTVDPATGRPAPGVAVYAFDAETAGTLLGSVLSDTGGGFVLDLPAVTADRVWVSTSTTGERFPVLARDALDRRALASDVAASLATKANASTVAAQTTRLDGLDTTVAGKADQTALTTGLGKKPDLTPQGLDLLRRQNAAALQRFWGGLGNRDTAPVKIMCAGDSVTEGQGADTRSRRWIERLGALLRQRYGITGEGVYLPAFYLQNSYSSPVTTTGTVSQDVGRGLGFRSVQMSPAATLTFSFTGTDAKVAYTAGTASTLDFTVQVDGGAGQVVTVAKTGGEQRGFYTISGLTAGAHTVKVTNHNAAGMVFINGLWYYTANPATGVHIGDAGHYGWTSAQFTSAMFSDVRAFAPNLIIVSLGLNDYNGKFTPASLATNLQTRITDWRGAATTGSNEPSFLILSQYLRGDTTNPNAPWADYVAAMYGLIANNADCAWLDLTGRMPAAPATKNTGGLLNADLVHPSNAGHAMIADAVMSTITPA